MLRVYFCLAEGDAPAFPDGLLSAYRKEKLALQKNPSVRSRSLFSELLLRYALRDCGFAPDAPLEITVGEYGKPRLTGGELCFNLSHSADALLCAVSDRRLGADVQRIGAAPDVLMERFFAEEERAYVLSSETADEAFTEIWTKKESWCKLSGKGLALPLPSFSVLDAQIAPLLWHRRAGDYHLCVCGEAVPAGQIEWYEVKTKELP